jgi:hypothetical protein
MIARGGVAALLVLTAGLAAGGAAAAENRTVERPMFDGNRLDWCATWQADCGRPAADAFCRSEGFGSATAFSEEPRIGAKTPTRIISTGAVCDQAGCSGFASITCAAGPSPGEGDRSAGLFTGATEAEAGTTEPLFRAAGTSAPGPKLITVPTPPQRAAAKAGAAKPAKLASAPVPKIAPAPRKVFAEPFFKGKRLDWCRGWKDTCGKSAADDYCKLKGYVAAVSYAPDLHIGARNPTRQIATGMVCDQAMCDGFKSITCSH